MNARIFICTLSLAGLAIGLGQWSAAVSDGESSGAERNTRANVTAGSESLTGRADLSTQASKDGLPGGKSQSAASGLSEGADIRYSRIHQTENYAPVGDIYAYAIGSRTCNVGDEPLLWQSNGTPGFASNAYRIHDGRMMHIGTAWVKHACCVANNNSPSVCGFACSQTGGGSTLNPGCMDVYSAGWNGLQGRFGPRVNINPYTGEFAPLQSDSYTTISRRLQIHRDDMDLSNYPGALYFVEGVYVCTSSIEDGNRFDNAHYRRVTFNQTTFEMSLAPQSQMGPPAIFAWQDHGLGIDTPDPDVEIVTLDLPNEGRFFGATKVSDNGDGTWRYEYAVYNLNSHQAAGEFSVEISDGVTISNVGFHSPPYHSGESQDTTPWAHTVTADSVTWSTTETHAQNPNANAIRWASMYNFWFDADQPPTTQQAHIGVFIPGADSGISFSSSGPGDVSTPCPADLDDNGEVDVDDLFILLSNWTGLGQCDDCGDCVGDLNDDCSIDIDDLFMLLGDWGPCQ